MWRPVCKCQDRGSLVLMCKVAADAKLRICMASICSQWLTGLDGSEVAGIRAGRE